MQAVVAALLRDLLAGKLRPPVVNAAANVARALVAITQTGEMEERLRELEARWAAGAGMTLRARLAKLEPRSPAREVGRLFILIPDLWPEDDRDALEINRGEALADLVARCTGGRRPAFPMITFR